MHFLSFKNLSLFILFSLYSSSKAFDDIYHYDEKEHTDNLSILSMTTTPSILDKSTKKRDDDDDAKTYATKVIDDIDDYFDNHESEDVDESNEKISSSTVLSSSTLKSVTITIPEKNLYKAEISSISPISISSTTSYNYYRTLFYYTTIDPETLAAHIAKTNRHRLLLKIFTITISIGVTSLAVALIIIHIVRKTKHYHGYHTTANTTTTTTTNKQVKYQNNNIYV